MSIIDKMTSDREALHRIPELGFKEVKTQKYLLDAIEEIGFKGQIICETGIYVYIESETLSDVTYAFRSDIDALSISEETNCEYSSTHSGLMHACGHDGHMAILLGFLRSLKGKKIRKNVLAIFQPAEEGPGGAKNIVESGILEKYNVKAIFGLHLFPNLEEGIIGCRPGGLMAKAAEIDITIIGKSGHGGQPHLGIDTIQVASKFLDGANLITSKYIGPSENCLVAIGKIYGGTIRNIIARTTILEGTIRALSIESFDFVSKKIKDLARGLELAYGVEIEIKIADGYPPVINTEKYVGLIKDSVSSIDNLKYKEIMAEMLAEDFGFYQEKIDGVFFFLGSRNEKLGYINSLHNSKFNFSKKVLEDGLKVYSELSKRLSIY